MFNVMAALYFGDEGHVLRFNAIKFDADASIVTHPHLSPIDRSIQALDLSRSAVLEPPLISSALTRHTTPTVRGLQLHL